jgi:hypothetical protein
MPLVRSPERGSTYLVMDQNQAWSGWRMSMPNGQAAAAESCRIRATEGSSPSRGARALWRKLSVILTHFIRNHTGKTPLGPSGVPLARNFTSEKIVAVGVCRA